jgi:GT2 family glycosyltransferase
MMESNHKLREVTVNAVVLIPAYNASTTIAETLDALQTSPELDCIQSVIVLDDASRDGTAEVAKFAWRSAVPLKIWSNEANVGERATVNSGVARLAVDIQWAFILHADDVVKSNWISLYLEEMAHCPDDVATICSSYDNWYPASGQIDLGEEYPYWPKVIVPGSRQAVLDTLNRGCWWHVSGCAIRTRAFHQIGGFEPNLPYSGDWEWLLRCLAKGFSVSYLPRSTMLYRQHARSVSSNSFRRGQDIKEILRVLADYRDQGYLSSRDYRGKIRHLIYQLSRRTLVRAVRGDPMGMRSHVHLLTRTSLQYMLKLI